MGLMQKFLYRIGAYDPQDALDRIVRRQNARRIINDVREAADLAEQALPKRRRQARDDGQRHSDPAG